MRRLHRLTLLGVIFCPYVMALAQNELHSAPPLRLRSVSSRTTDLLSSSRTTDLLSSRMNPDFAVNGLTAFYFACAVLPIFLRLALAAFMSPFSSLRHPHPRQVAVALSWFGGSVADLQVALDSDRQLDKHGFCDHEFVNLLPHPRGSKLGKAIRAYIFVGEWLMMLLLANTDSAAMLGAAAAPGWCAAMIAKVAWYAALHRWPVASLRSRHRGVASAGAMDGSLQEQELACKVRSCETMQNWESVEGEALDMMFAYTRKASVAREPAREPAAKVDAAVVELWLPVALLATSAAGLGVSHRAIHGAGYVGWGNALVRWPVAVHFGWACVAVLADLNGRLGQTRASLRTREMSAMVSVAVAVGAVAYVTVSTRDAIFAVVVTLSLAAAPTPAIDQQRRNDRYLRRQFM